MNFISLIKINLWKIYQKCFLTLKSKVKYHGGHLLNIGHYFRVITLSLNIEILCSLLIFIYLLIFWYFLSRIYFQTKLFHHYKITNDLIDNSEIRNNIGLEKNLLTILKINNQGQKLSFLSKNSRKDLQLDTSISAQKGLINQLKNLTTIIVNLVKNRLFSLTAQIQVAKRLILKSIIGYVAPPHRYVLSSMVFGDDSQLSGQIKHDLKITGMQHVIAVSGSNISLVVSLASLLISRFGGLKRLAILFGLIFVYVFLTDVSASVVRASLMMGLSLTIFTLIKRKIHPLTGWFWCVLGMTIMNPAYLTQVGFQLIQFYLLFKLSFGIYLVEKSCGQ